MAYVKQTWRDLPDKTTPITAARLSHMETQYDEAKAYIDALSPSSPEAGGVYNPRDYKVPGDGTTSASAALQSMLDSIPPGATVRFDHRDEFNLTSQVSLSKPVTFEGGRFKANPSGTTLRIAADDVTLSWVSITGSASTVSNSMYLIGSSGTRSAPNQRTVIRNCVLIGSGYAHIWLSWAKDFRVEDNDLYDAQYAGIILISPKTGVVEGNNIRKMRMTSPLINCYGIAATDQDNDATARAEDVLIKGNYVDGMPEWEGIDTHGGRNISIIGNTVRNCRTPIAVTTGNVNRVMPPESCTVIGNYVEKGTASTETAGIVFNGKSGGTLPDRIAHGTIGHNVIRGFQKDLILEYYDKARTTVAPQSHDGSERRSPGQSAFRSYGAATSVTATASPGGTRTFNFPEGLFTVPPIVSLTKSMGAGARHVPYVADVTTTSCTIGIYDGTGGTGTVTIPVHITATQYGPDGNGIACP